MLRNPPPVTTAALTSRPTQVGGLELDGPDLDVHRDLDLERTRPVEPQPGLGREREADAELRLQVHAAEQRGDEPVTALGVDDELAATDLSVQGGGGRDRARGGVDGGDDAA